MEENKEIKKEKQFKNIVNMEKELLPLSKGKIRTIVTDKINSIGRTGFYSVYYVKMSKPMEEKFYADVFIVFLNGMELDNVIDEICSRLDDDSQMIFSVDITTHKNNNL